MTPSRPPGLEASPGRPSPRTLLGLGLLAVVLAAGPVQATESLGVTPASHEITEAIPGETYIREITIQNEFDSPTTITLTATGDLETWLESSPGGSLDIPAREHEDVRLEVTVPEDAVDGSYEGRLHLTAEPKDQPEGSGASLRYALAVPFTVEVGGEAAPELVYGSPAAADVEAGSAPTAEVPITNEGNARAIAQACLLVRSADGQDTVQRLHEQTPVLPGEAATVEFPIETLPEGAYSLELRPDCQLLEAEARAGDPATFDVVPPGTLGKEARLVSIEHEPRVQPGQPLELRALLENTGEEAIARATSTFRIFHDGELVEVLESPRLLVPPGERRELTAFYTPEEPGRYDVTAKATYDGRQTDQRETFVVAGTTSASLADPPSLLPGLVVYLLAAGKLVWLGVFLWRADRPASRGPPEGQAFAEFLRFEEPS